jgi:hypothetical protein
LSLIIPSAGIDPALQEVQFHYRHGLFSEINRMNAPRSCPQHAEESTSVRCKWNDSATGVRTLAQSRERSQVKRSLRTIVAGAASIVK